MKFKIPQTNKLFFQKVNKIIMPSTIQTLMISSTNMLSVLLVGIFCGESAVSGTAIASTVFGLSMLLSYGASITGNIYAGQYYGQENWYMIKETTKFRIILSFLSSSLLVIVILAIGIKNVLVIFINPNNMEMQNTLINAVLYFKYMIWTCLITSISIPLIQTSNTLSKRHYATLSASGIALLMSSILSVLFMGFWRLPWTEHKDVQAAGFAYLISRFFELIIIIGCFIKTKPFFNPNLQFWKFNKIIWKKGTKTFILLLPSELFFQVYYVLFTIVIAHNTNTATLAAFNVSNVALDVFWCIINGFIAAIPKIVGRPLGKNLTKKAFQEARKLKFITFIYTSFLSIIFLILGVLTSVFNLVNFTKQAQRVLLILMISNSIIFFFYGNAYQTFNIVRAGNKQFLPSLLDMPPLYLLHLPLAFILMRYTKIDNSWILFIVNLVYLFQFFASNFLFYKIKWCVNIIGDKE